MTDTSMGSKSYQCAEFLGITVALAVCQSAAGFYLGAVSETGEPLCRDSAEYFPTREAAQAALDSGSWTQRYTP